MTLERCGYSPQNIFSCIATLLVAEHNFDDVIHFQAQDLQVFFLVLKSQFSHLMNPHFNLFVVAVGELERLLTKNSWLHDQCCISYNPWKEELSWYSSTAVAFLTIFSKFCEKWTNSGFSYCLEDYEIENRLEIHRSLL